MVILMKENVGKQALHQLRLTIERKSETYKLKNDIYRQRRGGKAFLIYVCCSNCSNEVLLYQKDGDGDLHRCYLNRIIEPETYANLSKALLGELPALRCDNCNEVLGTPIIYHDGRLAYGLRVGHIYKVRATDVKVR